jgi:hypothetical protein
VDSIFVTKSIANLLSCRDGMCVLLASKAGSYINGADMVIDGGAIIF